MVNRGGTEEVGVSAAEAVAEEPDVFREIHRVVVQNCLSPDPLLPLTLNRVCSQINSLCRQDPEAARRAIGEHLAKDESKMQTIVDNAVALPEMRVGEVELKRKSFNYYGRDFVVKKLTKGDHTAYELDVGYLCVLDSGGNPVGILDVYPHFREPWFSSDPPLKVSLIPPDRLFHQVFKRVDEGVNKEEILEFLKAYPEFFDQKGEFAKRAGLANSVSLSTLPSEAKFSIFKFFSQKETTEDERKEIYDLFQGSGLLAGYFLKPAIEQSSSLLPLARLGNKVTPELIEVYCQAAENWIKGEPRFQPEELALVMKEVFPDSASRPPEEERLIAEALAWVVEVEAFFPEMADLAVLPEKLRTSEMPEFVVNTALAIQGKTREMIIQLAEIIDEYPNYLEAHREEVDYHLSGLRAQAALLSLMASEGVEGIAKELQIPSFFWEQLRDNVARLNSKAALDLLLELWQQVHIMKIKGKGLVGRSPAEIRIHWQAHEATGHLEKGLQSARTETEIARDESALRELRRRNWLPKKPVFVIDFGSWDGKRRLKPFLRILRGMEVGIRRVVGVDISNPPYPIPEMELKVKTYIEAGQDEDLRGADFGKSDWSAANDSYTVYEQVLNMLAYNLCLKKGDPELKVGNPDGREVGGIFIIDTAFPEGPGSYDEMIRAYKKLFPDQPEGVFMFGYDDVDKKKHFMLYYYEILVKLVEDAGFEILNLPESEEERGTLFSKVIKGEIDLAENERDPFKSPFWPDPKGRPRITLVLRKVRKAGETQNLVARRLFLEVFAGS